MRWISCSDRSEKETTLFVRQQMLVWELICSFQSHYYCHYHRPLTQQLPVWVTLQRRLHVVLQTVTASICTTSAPSCDSFLQISRFTQAEFSLHLMGSGSSFSVTLKLLPDMHWTPTQFLQTSPAWTWSVTCSYLQVKCGPTWTH